tara:strand:+ start:130 stop:705 length:576 start_codon:yes stop_codon:yes gene_type:complete
VSILAKVGYARVSTSGQSFELQVEKLKQHGCEKIFSDIVSGKSSNRIELTKMRAYVREFDEILCCKLDRLGRNTRDMIALIEEFTEKDIHVTFIDDGISTKGTMGRMTITILSAVAEAERERILERTNEGREAAIKRGVKMGRKPTISESIKIEIRNMVESGTPKIEVARFFGISRTKVYQILDENHSSNS